MRHVREVLRLKAAGVSGNEIARRLNVAPSTVRSTLQRIAAAGLGWPLPAEMTDAGSAALHRGRHQARASPPRRARLGRDSSRAEAKHVTLAMLWDEYIERCPDPTYADAILDRLVHNAHRIDLAGDSLRRRRPVAAMERRIASPEVLSDTELLPHLICSPLVGGGGDIDEADQHGSAR
jgi:IstB-like ATP binding protein/Bacterial regulatory proteins, luxR family